MDLTAALRLLHVLTAVALVVGIVGRDLALRRASRRPDMACITRLVAAAGRFERLLVRPGSLLVLLAGVATMWAQGRPLVAPGSYWLTISIALFLTSIPLVAFVFMPRGRIFEAALAGAVAAGRRTPELGAAFADRAVTAARRFEALALALVVALMVTRPF